jgi:N-acyl-D-aspartate/D-glutamate deacylase
VIEFDFAKPFPFESMSLFKPVSAADRAGRKRIYADPEFRAAFRQRSLGGGIAGSWPKMQISHCPTEPALQERNVAEAAAERGVHPVDLVLDLALGSDLGARFRTSVMNDDESIVAELLVHPAVTLGLSDAGAHASQLCDANFATHLLGHWVRDKRVLELEQAVRMLTSRSADLLGIADRGRVAVGLAADLCVFDPDEIGCSPLRRVRDLPQGADRLISDAFGIHAVIVNGVMLRERGEDRVDPASTLPGRLVRGGRA